MFRFLSQIASQVFIDSLSLDLSSRTSNRLSLRVKDLSIRDEKSGSIILDDLSVLITDFSFDEKGISLEKALFILEKYNLIISQDWINSYLASDGNLENNKLSGLKIVFTDNKISIFGTYKSLVDFPFSIDLKIDVEGGILRVVFDRFWAMDLLPMPRWVQSTILSSIQNYLETRKKQKKGISFCNQNIFIHYPEFIPEKYVMKIDRILTKEGYLILQGSATADSVTHLLSELKTDGGKLTQCK